MLHDLFVILAPIAASISIGLGVYAWRRRRVPAAAELSWCSFIVSGWLVTNTLELAAPTESGTLLWAKIAYLFIAFGPVAWLAFALRYTGRHAWLARARFWVFCIFPVVFFLLALTNDAHHLVWQGYSFSLQSRWLALWIEGYGPWFWFQAALNYVLILLGAVLIGRAYLTSHRPFRQQTLWAIVGATSPLVLNFLYVSRLIPGFRKDYTPVAFAFGGLAFGVAIFRHRLFELMPVARRVLVDSMDDGMLVLDEQDRIVDLNPAARSIVGVLAERAFGQPVAQVWSAWQDLASRLHARPEGPFEIELERDGGLSVYDVRVSPLVDRHGRLTGRLIVLRDITQRREAEELLRQSNLELQSRNEELDAFAHTVAHDLKDPLGMLSAYSELLVEGWADGEDGLVQKSVEAIAASSARMAAIVDELLLLASVRKEEVVLEVLDMAPIVASVLARLEAEIARRQAEISLPEAWPRVLGHGPWVEEVWANLINNALVYGGQRPCLELGADAPPVSPSPAAEGQAESMVRFWVRDHGPGIPPEEQERLFAEFARLHQVRAEGHGLGLSIVRRIIDKLGGQVGVESAVGQGSLFYFTLAAAPRPAGEA